MADSAFIKSCKKMVEDGSDGSMIFPGTNHTLSPGSWKIVQLLGRGKSLAEVEGLVGRTWINIARHIKGQRCNQVMENSLLAATNTENSLDEQSITQVATESLKEDEKALAEVLTNASDLLMDFLKKSNPVDRENLREMLAVKTKQDLRLSVKALMSELNFKQIKEEGGLK